MPTYQHNPHEVEAIQWTGNNYRELCDFAGYEIEQGPVLGYLFPQKPATTRLEPGDYLVKGVAFFYPMAKSSFEFHYDLKSIK